MNSIRHFRSFNNRPFFFYGK